MYSTYRLKEGSIPVGSRQELPQIDTLAAALPTRTITATMVEKYESVQSEGTERMTETIFRTETGDMLLYRTTRPTRKYFAPGSAGFEIIEYAGDADLAAKRGGKTVRHTVY